MDKIVAIAPAKITQIREAGRKALSPVEFSQLNELINQLAIYGLTPYINSELGRLMAKFGWELEVEESPEWAEALIACDVAFLGAELKEMCRENGMSDYGHKKELCRRLYNAKVEEVVEIMRPIIERGGTAEGEKETSQGELEKSVRKMYQRGLDGYPLGSDKMLREAYGPIPNPDQPFWSGKGFIKPVKIYGWDWAPDYNTWRAYVKFPDGTETWTSPRESRR